MGLLGDTQQFDEFVSEWVGRSREFDERYQSKVLRVTSYLRSVMLEQA